MYFFRVKGVLSSIEKSARTQRVSGALAPFELSRGLRGPSAPSALRGGGAWPPWPPSWVRHCSCPKMPRNYVSKHYSFQTRQTEFDKICSVDVSDAQSGMQRFQSMLRHIRAGAKKKTESGGRRIPSPRWDKRQISQQSQAFRVVFVIIVGSDK